jgi:type 1 glutamine amidotransferase
MRPTRLLVTLFAASIALLAATLVAPSAHAHEVGFRALLFTKTATGAYRHGSIPAGVRMFQELAAKDGFTLVHSEESAVFNDAELASYDVVIMFQVSGMVWNTEEQRAAMQKYVREGGGIVAIHNATDMNIESAFSRWDQVVMGGAHMTAHSATVPGTAKVADRVHPSTAGLPERWQRTEEWYNFDKNARGNVHVLVTADETTYNAGPNKMGHDHPPAAPCGTGSRR